MYCIEKIQQTAEYVEPNAAPYIFLNIGRDGYHFAKKILQKGLIVIPGIAFGDNVSHWIRINYAVQPYLLKEGIDKLINEL